MNNTDLMHDLETENLLEDEGGQSSHWILTISILLILSLVGLFVADRIFHPEKFQIKQIEIRGALQKVESSQVSRVVENTLSGNYFTVSLAHLESEIKKLPWVFSVSLRRQWPATIMIDIEEVQPVARWGDSQWMNFTGDLVDREIKEAQGLHNPLPLLYGSASRSREIWSAFSQWSEKFALNGLNLDELHLDQRGIWKLRLSLGALTLSGLNTVSEENAESNVDPSSRQVLMIVDKADAYRRIERFINTLNQQLLVKFAGMQSIDLRYPNGFAIRWREQGPDSPLLSDNSNKGLPEINTSTQSIIE